MGVEVQMGRGDGDGSGLERAEGNAGELKMWWEGVVDLGESIKGSDGKRGMLRSVVSYAF